MALCTHVLRLHVCACAGDCECIGVWVCVMSVSTCGYMCVYGVNVYEYDDMYITIYIHVRTYTYAPVYMHRVYIYTGTYIHACMHACISAWHCITLHYITVHYIMLHYITYVPTYILTYLQNCCCTCILESRQCMHVCMCAVARPVTLITKQLGSLGSWIAWVARFRHANSIEAETPTPKSITLNPQTWTLAQKDLATRTPTPTSWVSRRLTQMFGWDCSPWPHVGGEVGSGLLRLCLACRDS